MPELDLSRSEAAHESAKEFFPGGVNSPVRALGSVGGTPFFAVGGKGAEIQDVDGNSYVDLVLGYGPLILGHAHQRVAERLQETVEEGWSYGAPTPGETALAERVRDFFPSMERMRFVNSGTEATMSAMRLARGFTGRDLVLKFEGCYHGHVDSLLVKAGSGALTHGRPDSAGVPASIAGTTLLAPYNDIEAVRGLFSEHGESIAAVIVEPVAGNMGVVPPVTGFLSGLQELSRTHGALLIFDEVMTGCRVSRGGAQELYGVRPDLTCLGKVIGGGLPIGAFGGRAEIMSKLAPEGPVYQAGTLSGNPLSMAAGDATMEVLADRDPFSLLAERASALANELRSEASRAGVPACVQHVGSMLTLFFNPGPVRNLEDAKASDTELYGRFYHAMRERGVSIPPSQFEAWFLGTPHDGPVLERIVAAVHGSLKEIQ
jgi:glutamate-1-semialdehyde 2,1-aminomutase